ncbi:MAG: SMC-Scp complex subunit ScpB [Myxococcota bacterium]|nr:SMC-Scp complex subunit ScpB [Myxococcota bacterium]
MALNESRLCSIIESMLLVSSEPLPVARLVEVIQGEDKNTKEEKIRAAIESLKANYDNAERKIGQGVRVDEVAGGLQMRTTSENAQYIRRLLAMRPQRLTKAALETLAIIAYRQPCTKPEIENVRGVDVGSTLKALLERDLVRILGKKDEVGRPLLYGTTRAFLELFGLRSLSALPSLREYHELDPAHQQQVDELYEPEPTNTLQDLAGKVEFLVDRDHDPDLDELDEALKQADSVRQSTSSMLDAKSKESGEKPKSSSEENSAKEPSNSPEEEPAREQATS